MPNLTLVKNYGTENLEWLLKGYMHNVSTVAAGIALVTPTTANQPSLWNPQGSGKIFVLTRATFQPDSTALTVNSGICFAINKNCGSTIATAAPVSVFTEAGTKENCLMGWPADTSIKWSPATNTVAAAPTVHSYAGFVMPTTTGASGTFLQAAGGSKMEHIFRGELAVLPGQILQIVSTNAASGVKFAITLTFGAVPASELGVQTV